MMHHKNFSWMDHIVAIYILLFGLLFAPTHSALANDLPAGFTNELILDGLFQPVDIASLPNGSIVVIERRGTIQITDPSVSNPTASSYLTLPNVDNGGEKGLLSIALDPDFAQNNFFYLYYHNSSVDRARVSRFTHNGNTASVASEFVIWEDIVATSTQVSPDHWGGAFGFGPDDFLYLAIGDKKDFPEDAQNLQKSSGKILRFNTKGATAGASEWNQVSDNAHLVAAGNPYIDGVGGNLDEIWAVGLRNPFRGRWDLLSDRFYIGEVGGNVGFGANASFEDIHTASSNDAGANFGFPACEGPTCVGGPPDQYSPPLFSIQHPASFAIVVGPVYRGSQFPSEYNEVLFFTDYAHGYLKYLKFNQDGTVVASTPPGGFIFGGNDTLGFAPVAMIQGVDEALYYVDFFYNSGNGNGSLNRIVFDDSNAPPVIQDVNADNTVSPGAPFTVNFSATATDPEGQPLLYSWDFGDGTSPVSGSVTQKTFEENGTYNVVLRVSDSLRTATADPITIEIGSPPVASIDQPSNNTVFRAGDVLQFKGSGTDAGEVISNEQLQWTINFKHNSHFHPVVTSQLGEPCLPSGSSCFEYTVPSTGHDYSEDTSYEVMLTVTDSDDTTDTAVVSTLPDKVFATFTTNVPGQSNFFLDQLPRPFPLTIDTLIGFEHLVSVPEIVNQSGTVYQFVSWSDGVESRTRPLLIPDTAITLTAEYENLGTLPRVAAGLQALYTFDEGSGDTVFDVSGVGTALDLTIPDASKVSWGDGTLSTIASTRIESAGPATKLRTALQATQALTLEAWVAPSNLTQAGPAPIVTMSYTPFYRSVALHQNANAYEVNLSTTQAGNQGNLPTQFSSPANAVQTELMHIVYTRQASGEAKLYIDNELVSSTQVNGNLSTWRTDVKLALGNELLFWDRPWLGAYNLLAFYNRALSAAEVNQNYIASPNIVTVNTPPVAVNDAVTADADQVLNGNVLDANSGDADSDVDDDPLSVVALNGNAVTSLTLASGALVTLNANGNFSYDPNAQFGGLTSTETGTDSFDYTISDSQGGESTATVQVSIRAINVAPLAQDDDVSTDEDTLLSGNILSDNGNGADDDANADALVVVQVNADTDAVGNEIALSSGALLTLESNGDFNYNPNGSFDALNPGEQDTDAFTYTISDGRGGDSTATVTVAIDGLEEPPISPRVETGIQALYTFDEGSGDTVFDVSGVGTALDLTIPDTSKVSWGDGTLITIASTRIESAGPATKLRSALQATQALTLEAWVAPSNLTQAGPAPIVTMSYTPFYRSVALHQNADAYEVNLSTTRAGNQGNLPTQFSSPDNAVQTELMHIVYTREASGAAKLYIDNELVSSTQVNGDLSTWRTDVKLALGNELLFWDRPWLGAYNLLAFYDRALSAAEVNQNFIASPNIVTVNTPPVAVNDTVTADADQVLNGNVLDANGGDADSDINDDLLTVVALNGNAVTSLTLASGALVTLDANGDFSYDPNGQFGGLTSTETGADNFDYTISDGQGGESTATVQVSIRAINVAPIAQDDDVTTDEDTLLSGNVLSDNGNGADEDTNADALVVVQVNADANTVGSEIALSSGALVTVGSDGQFNYDPNSRFDALNPGEQDNDTFTYTISDGRGSESTATVTVTIDGLEEPPISPRVETGIQALYTFDEGSGDTVFDVSGVGTALDLTIPDASKVSWGNGTLITIASTRIESAGSATKLRSAIQATQALTLEAWVAPSNLTQAGPAPIVTMSYTPFYRSVALHQNANAYEVNLSTTQAGNQGNLPTQFSSPANAVQTELMHIVYTRQASGEAKLYIDNELVSSTQVNGNLSTWRTDVKLALGNELLFWDRPWLGAYNLLAFYNRALSAAEVNQNYIASPNIVTVNTPPVAVNDAVSTDADQVLNGNVLDANGGDPDSDVDDDPLSVIALNGNAVTSLTLASGALVTLNANGNFSYDPNAQFGGLTSTETGTDSFDYTISDSQGGESTATVQVSIRAINVAPLAQDDDVSTDEDTLLSGNILSDNGNGADDDTNADALVVVQVNTDADAVGNELTLSSGALVTVNSDGQFNYDPNGSFDALNPGEQDTDTFTYTISDGRGGDSTATVTVVIDGLEEPPISPRVETGIQALYMFNEGSGDTVFDISGVGTALDLTIPDASKVSWGNGTLITIASTRIESAGPATKLRSALQATQALTLEAWVQPSNLTQAGPAPIVTMSYTPFYRSVALHQNADAYEVNLSTTRAGNQGNLPTQFSSPANAVQTELMHIVYTREASGEAKLYIDDELVSSTQVNGDLSTWRTDVKLALGNELLYWDRPWLGAYDLLAFYDRALSAAEVSQNFTAGTAPSTEDTSPPEVPQNLAATQITTSEITLVWDTVEDIGDAGLAGYRIYRDGVLLGDSVLPTYADTGLEPETIYTYSVLAFDAAEPPNESATTNLVVETQEEPDTLAPSVPAGFQASSVSAEQVDLVWQASIDEGSAGLAGYRLYRDGVLLATPTELSYTDNAPVPSTTHQYELSAIDGADNESVTTVLDVLVPALPDTEPPTVPQDLAVTELGSTSVSISWTASTDTGGSGLAGYRVLRDGVLLAEPENPGYQDTGLQPEVSYTYSVMAFDAADPANESAPAELSITTEQLPIVSPPVNVAAGVQNAQVTLSWQRGEFIGSGIAYHEVRRDGVIVANAQEQLSYLDSDVVVATTYEYEVRSVDTNGQESEWSETVPVNVYSIPDYADMFDGNLPLAGMFYGNYETGLYTGNASIGYESSRRFRAEKTGYIQAVKYNNRTLTQTNITNRCENSGPESVWCLCEANNLDPYTCGYTLGSSYTVGNGGSIVIEIHGDLNGLPDNIPLGRTAGVFIPLDNAGDIYPELNLENAIELTAGRTYHLVYRNLTPPTGCNLGGMSVEDAANCPTDQGAMALNGTLFANSSSPQGTFDPFRGETPANFFKAQLDGEWYRDFNNLSWYEVQYTDGTWIGDSYTAFDSPNAGEQRVEGDVIARQRFTVLDTDRTVDGLWLNFGHASSPIANGDSLQASVKNQLGEVLAQGEIAASETCRNMAVAGLSSQNPLELNCRDWGYAKFDADILLSQGNEFSVEFSAPQGAAFVLSAYFPLNYGLWQSTSRNHWDQAMAEISEDVGQTWSNWTTTYSYRDLGLLFSIKDKPRSLAPPDTQAPDVPQNLVSTQLSPTSVSLSWTASYDVGGAGLAGYQVSRDGVLLTQTASAHFTDSQLQPESSYTYSVSAYDAALPANVSATAELTVTLDPLPGISAPINLEASVAQGQIALQWQTGEFPGSGFAYHEVRRDGVLVATEIIEPNYQDTDVATSATYEYEVRSVDTNGEESAWSDLLTVTLDIDAPGVPQNLVVSQVDHNSVTLQWDAVEDTGGAGLAGYRIFRDGELLDESVNTQFQDSGLQPEESYTYSVLAFDAAVPANESAEASVTVETEQGPVDNEPPTVPTALSAVNVLHNTVTLSWEVSTDTGGSGLGGYSIYRNGVLLAEGIDNTYVDSTVLEETTYQYAVLAYDNATPRNESETADLEVQTPLNNPDIGYECLAVGPELVSHYRFDESELSVLNDSGSGLAGSSTNVQSVSGQLGNAALFTASSEALMGQSDFALSTGVSITMWVKPSTLSSVEARFISQATSIQNPAHYLMAGAFAGDALRFRLKTGGVGGATTTLISTSGQLQTDEWSFVAFTYDGQSMSIYNAGQLVAQSSKSGLLVQAETIAMALGNQPPGAGDRPFLGDMDDVRIYSSALNEQEIEQIMAYRLEDCAPDAVPPSVPQNLAATELSPNNVSLAWSASTDSGGAGLAGYRVLRDGVLLAEPTSEQIQDTSVTPDSSYTYSIVAYDAAVPANVSSAASLTISTPLEADLQPPSAPAAFTTELISAEQVELEWEASTDQGSAGLLGYEISRDGVLLSATTNLSFIDENPVASSTHEYSLVALDNALPANVSTATTVTVDVPAVIDNEPPSTIANLRIDSIGSNFVTLLWDEATDTGGAGLGGYTVFKDDIELSTVSTPGVDDTNVVIGETYTYTIRAFDLAQPANIGAASSIDVNIPTDVEPPESPQSLVTYDITADSVRLMWQESADVGGGSVTEYIVYRDDSQIGTSVGNEFADDSLNADFIYSYHVTAIDNSGNESDTSTLVTVRTLSLADSVAPSVPQNLTSTVLDTGVTLLSWDASTDDSAGVGLSGYQLYKNDSALAFITSDTDWTELMPGDGLPTTYAVSAIDRAGNESAKSVDLIVTLSTVVNDGAAPTNLFDTPVQIYNSSATSVAWADIDQDNDLDITVVEGGKFHNNGPVLDWFEAPHWGRRTIGETITPFTGDSKLADVDADGDVDFIVAVDTHSGDDNVGRVYWYENNGSYFSNWPQHLVEANVPNAFHIGELQTGDIDGDGLMDIAVRHLSTPRFVLYFQNVDDSWTTRRIDTVLREGLALSDLDEDGKLDIIANGFILFAPNDPRVDDWPEVIFDAAFFNANQVHLNNSTKAATGDLSGDGKPDIVITAGEGNDVYLAWYENPADSRNGNWISTTIETPQTGNHQVLLGDIDLDGDLDIAGGFSFGETGVHWWDNINGDASTFERRDISTTTGCYSCVLADYDQDGDLDLMGPTQFIGPVYLYRNRATDLP